MQTEESQPEDKRIMPEKKFTEFPARIIRWPEGWDFSVCIGVRWLIVFLTYYIWKTVIL